MKHIKLYEELLKDLRGLGISGPRVSMKFYKATQKNREKVEPFFDIIFPKLEDKEERIGYQDIADSFLEEDYVFEAKSPEISGAFKSSSVFEYIDSAIHKYTLKHLRKREIDIEGFITDLLFSFSLKSRIELEIDGDIKISKEK